MNQVAVIPDTAVMQVIARAAADPTVDVAKLERLLDMQERIVAKEAEMAFARDMALMQPQLPVITEKGEIKVNGVLRSKYAKFEDINEAVKPILHTHGFAITFRTDTSNGHVKVTGVLTHRLGHRETTDLILPVDVSGSKNPVQAIGSSVSYGKRYVSEALLNLTSRGQDDDGTGGNKPVPDAEGKKALEECGSLATLKAAWGKLTAKQRSTLNGIKDECKERIINADKEAA
jgi:hypothetical protein